MWPNSRISVMGGEQAANVLLQVKLEQLKRRGQPTMSPDDQEAFMAPILAKYEREGCPFYSSARLWDDGVIEPPATRRTLALALSMTLNAEIEETPYGVFRF
jgi:acetyl-CoA carboxylase carboxyltransferase component